MHRFRPAAAARLRAALAGGLLAAASASPVLAQGSGSAAAPNPAARQLYLRTLAASCAQCHGTDGHAMQGEAMTRLAGMPKEWILTQLLAFRTGDRKATIMHQITKGYSEEQLDQLASYFAAQPATPTKPVTGSAR